MKIDEVVVFLMKEIMYESGWVSRVEPEYLSPYWIEKITPVAESFFDKHPHLKSSDYLVDIALGNPDGSGISVYSSLEGYAELEAVLHDYWEDSGVN